LVIYQKISEYLGFLGRELSLVGCHGGNEYIVEDERMISRTNPEKDFLRCSGKSIMRPPLVDKHEY